MKIYNEIVFDVDGNVIYEDSFEYSGDVMLCQRIPDMNNDGFVNVQDYQAYAKQLRDENPTMSRDDINAIMEGRVSTSIQSEAKMSAEGTGAYRVERAEVKDPALSLSASPLPSLPSVSNVGSVQPTGVINLSSVPGGFQPLPPITGNRKKLYQLSQFHGGINQRRHGRDLSDQECQEGKNVAFSEIGQIVMLGHCQFDNNNIEFSTVNNRCLPGYGLFEFSAPADWNNTKGNAIITITADGEQVDAFGNFDGASTDFMDLPSTDNTTDIAQIYYSAGNGVYVTDSNFANVESTAPSVAKVYVYRKDYDSSGSAANLITSKWATGTPLIASPYYDKDGTDQTVHLEWMDGDSGGGFTISTTAGAAIVHISSGGTGNWGVSGTATEYYFWISWIFDGGAETGLTPLVQTGASTGSGGGASKIPQFLGESLYFNFSFEDDNSSRKHIGNDARIDGAKIYFQESGTPERFLLAEINLEQGGKGALGGVFVPWSEDGSAADTFSLSSNIVFESPPAVKTFLSENGYLEDEVYSKSALTSTDDTNGPTPHPIRYKAVTVGAQGIVYIGNIMFQGKHMPDSMMMSMPGKPAVFPQYNKFDAPSSDGFPITALASFGDTILQFKVNSLYVINIANPGQAYAETIYRDCGVFNPCQVFTCSFGVIFVNKHGCYIYDGQKVISLTDGKFDWIGQSNIAESFSNESTGDVPCIGYDPRSSSIVVLKDIGDDSTDDDGWIYHMPTQSWSEVTSFIDNDNGRRHSNFIITSAGYLSIKRDNENGLLNFNHIGDGNQTIDYITKDIDFGLPSQTKKIFKIYVTYAPSSSVPTLKYGVDGDTDPTDTFDSGSFLTSGDILTATFTVNDDALTGIYSLQLRFTGTAHYSFAINDISILYRVRPLK